MHIQAIDDALAGERLDLAGTLDRTAASHAQSNEHYRMLAAEMEGLERLIREQGPSAAEIAAVVSRHQFPESMCGRLTQISKSVRSMRLNVVRVRRAIARIQHLARKA